MLLDELLQPFPFLDDFLYLPEVLAHPINTKRSITYNMLHRLIIYLSVKRRYRGKAIGAADERKMRKVK